MAGPKPAILIFCHSYTTASKTYWVIVLKKGVILSTVEG